MPKFRCSDDLALAKEARNLRDLHVRVADHLKVPVERIRIQQVRSNLRWYWEITDGERTVMHLNLEDAVNALSEAWDDSPTIVEARR